MAASVTIATTRATLYRTSPSAPKTDALGDEVDSDVASDIVLANFPVSIIERTRREFDPSSSEWRSVRYYVGRTSARVTPQAGDRIRDLVTGEFYIVSDVERMARGLAGRSSVTLKMRRAAP